jgi:DNA-binding transcriptional MerR regulator
MRYNLQRLEEQAMSKGLSIGEAARKSGVKAPTIRYYEQIGLLPAPPRTDGNRRQFDVGDLRRLAFIRHARGLGFELDAIRTLLSLQDEPAQSCELADEIARSHLTQIESRIGRLRALRKELRRMLEHCARGRIAECRVIETLADVSHKHGPLM